MTRASRVVLGRWKFVTRLSTRRKSIARDHEQFRATLERPAGRDRLEHPDDRRPDGDHAVRTPYPLARLPADCVPFAVKRVLVDFVDRDRPERVEPDVQGDAGDVKAVEHVPA